jgi:hypothetical protein
MCLWHLCKSDMSVFELNILYFARPPSYVGSLRSSLRLWLHHFPYGGQYEHLDTMELASIDFLGR